MVLVRRINFQILGVKGLPDSNQDLVTVFELVIVIIEASCAFHGAPENRKNLRTSKNSPIMTSQIVCV